MQQADGVVLIRAEFDTAQITAGIAEIRAALDALKTYASRQLASIRSQTQSEGNAFVGSMPGLASRLVAALSSGIVGGGSRISGALRGVLGGALGVGTEYAPRFSSIGSYVITGIINGIQGNASALWNTLRTVASNMLATLKNALGIQSPSRVMREEVGRQIGAGIAAGMLDSRDLVLSASDTLAEDAVGRVRRMRVGSVGAAGTLLRSTTSSSGVPASVRGYPTAVSASEKHPAPSLGGNTFIFQKPVETPYRHAQAIREVMEEMLYGT